MPRDCLSDPEEAIDVWPRGGCWLQDEACQVSVGRVSQSIGGGLPSQQRFKGFKLFKGLEGLSLNKPLACFILQPTGTPRPHINGFFWVA